MNKKIKYCRTCGNAAKTNRGDDACTFHSTGNHIHIIHNLDTEYCHAHNSTTLERCDICSALVDPKNMIIIPEEEDVRVLCPNCYSMLGTCGLCADSGKCDFETNPIPIPKQTMRVMRQGNAVVQTMVINPDRIAETCAKNCRCWDHEYNYCRKEVDGLCLNYKERGNHNE